MRGFQRCVQHRPLSIAIAAFLHLTWFPIASSHAELQEVVVNGGYTTRLTEEKVDPYIVLTKNPRAAAPVWESRVGDLPKQLGPLHKIVATTNRTDNVMAVTMNGVYITADILESSPRWKPVLTIERDPSCTTGANAPTCPVALSGPGGLISDPVMAQWPGNGSMFGPRDGNDPVYHQERYFYWIQAADNDPKIPGHAVLLVHRIRGKKFEAIQPFPPSEANNTSYCTAYPGKCTVNDPLSDLRPRF